MWLISHAQTTEIAVVNPGFEDPDDNWKYQWFYGDSVPGWSSDDHAKNHCGRETPGLNGKYRAYMCGQAGEVYQVIGPIPEGQVEYKLSIHEKMNWMGGGVLEDDTVYHILSFSAYSSTDDPSTRVKIDTFPKVWYKSVLGTYSPDTILSATLHLPWNHAYAGKQLTIGYYLRNKHADRDTAGGTGSDWDNIDSVSLTQTLIVDVKDAHLATKLSVSPNPSFDGKFNLKSTGVFKYEVFDFAGKLIQSGISSGNDLLDLKANKGVYLLRATGNNFNATKKLIIQ
jgi:hypothetical protein